MAKRPWPTRRWVGAGCLIGLILAGALEGYHVTLGPNFHTVLPGRVYRSALPSSARLDRLVRSHGIRMVVNLRGYQHADPNQLLMDATAERLGLSLVHLGLQACSPVPAVEAQRFLEILDRGPFPMLIHCHSGGDRAGWASVMVLLRTTDADLTTARRQLGLRFGHFSPGRAKPMDQFFDLYAEWLERQGLQHSPERLQYWVFKEYRSEDCQRFDVARVDN